MKIEVCVDRIDDAITAAEAGADRIEFNYALGQGGLTPTLSSTRWLVDNCNAPIVVMVRPHDQGFVYSNEEAELMLEDCRRLLDCGAHGIVSGRLTPAGTVDQVFIAKLIELCGKREFIFHRAFDEIPHQEQAIRELIDLGVTRILTSGGKSTAWEGRYQLAKLQLEFGNQIELLPGSGVNQNNAEELAAAIGVGQLHGSFKLPDKVSVDATQVRALRAL